MRYDIAKNEDGPLRSTLRTEQTSSRIQPVTPGQEAVLEGRIRDAEDHLAVRYGTLAAVAFHEV
jgi:hypothetical protein